jgi:hypothetical protein
MRSSLGVISLSEILLGFRATTIKSPASSSTEGIFYHPKLTFDELFYRAGCIVDNISAEIERGAMESAD